MNEQALAKRDAAITPRQEIGREVMLRPEGDEEFRSQLRKLGNLHLGVKVQTQNGKEYPKATEYFVLPDSLRTDPEFREALCRIGTDPDKPTRLPIMLLADALGTNLVTSCDLYGSSGKLKCRSYDGKTCTRLNDKTCEYDSCDCGLSECQDYDKGHCGWYHRFRFLLPDAAGIGYWQIATKSDNNRGALLREMNDLRKMLGGRIAGRDLQLVLTNEREFHVPVTDRSGKTSMMTTAPYLLHLEAGTSLRKLMQQGPTGDVYEAEVIEESSDLDEVIVNEEEFEVGEIPEPEVLGEEFDQLLERCGKLLEELNPGNEKLQRARRKSILGADDGELSQLDYTRLEQLEAGLLKHQADANKES